VHQSFGGRASGAAELGPDPADDPLDRSADGPQRTVESNEGEDGREQGEEEQRAAQAMTARSLGTGALRIDPMTATIGSANSTPFDTIAVAARAAPALPRSTPDTESMRNPAAAPMAPPPGTVLLTAFETSCEVPATNHETIGSAVRVSFHWQAKLPPSSSSIATNQSGLRPLSRGISVHTSRSWGNNP
jgi:hypothetical protein